MRHPFVTLTQPDQGICHLPKNCNHSHTLIVFSNSAPPPYSSIAHIRLHTAHAGIPIRKKTHFRTVTLSKQRKAN